MVLVSMIRPVDLERRRYTLCKAFLGIRNTPESFLVPATSRAEARCQASAYVEARWPGRRRFILFYPGGNLREARRLWSEGCFEEAPSAPTLPELL